MKRILNVLCIIMLTGIFTTSSLKAAEGEWEIILCNPLLRQLEMDSTWDAAKAVGVKAIELGVAPDLSCNSLYLGKERPYKVDTPENAERVREDAKKHGLRLPVICAPIRIDGKSEQTGAPDWAKTLIKNARYTGAQYIYFPVLAGKIEDSVFVERSTALLKDLLACGEEHDVETGIENLSYYWNRPEITNKVINRLKPAQLSLCVDPINFYWYGHPRSKVYEIVKKYIPRAKHFHVKNVAHPKDQIEAVRKPGWEYGKNSVPAAEGDLDFNQILTWLHDSGYKGYISIEDDSLGHYPAEKRADILKQDVAYLEQIIKRF